jgi:hypothetical protein
MAVLPGRDEVGRSGAWDLPVDDGTGHQIIRGTFIGFATSQRREHELGRYIRGELVDVTHFATPDRELYAEPGQRCGRCRWFEPRIFRLDPDPDVPPAQRNVPRYAIHYTGATRVPGESQRSRLAIVTGAHSLLEQATARDVEQRRAFITPPMARCLAMAAEYDEDVERVWVNRAVD